MLKFILSSVFLTIFSFDVWACSCLGQGIVKAYYGSDAVFVGVVRDIREYGENIPLKVTFEETEMFNEYPHSQKINVYTHPSGATCGYSFKRNTSYVVFAHKSDRDSHSSKQGELHVSLCSRTTVSDFKLLETLREYKETPPAIPKHICDRSPCRLSTADSNYLYGLQGDIATDPAAMYEIFSDLDDNCVRRFGQEWAKKDSRAMLERLNGNFKNQLQCLTYEYGYVIDNALGEIKPQEAIAWLEANGVTEHREERSPYQSYFHFWMYEDADSAVEWYRSNQDKVSSGSLLNAWVFAADKDLFLTEYKALDFEDKVAVSLSLVESFKREKKSSYHVFLNEIDDPEVLKWVNLLIATWEGSIKPGVILDKAINSFLAGDKSTTGDKLKYPFGFYSVIQLVCFDDVPQSVRHWVTETSYLDRATKADLHAMLDSREYSFRRK